MENKEKKPDGFRTTIGGQALIEGILMRGPEKEAAVVRTADGLVTRQRELRLVKERYPILGLPFIRGVVSFIDSMIKGVDALTWSASLIPEDDQEPQSRLDAWIEKKVGGEKAQKVFVGIALALGLALAVALFIFLPTFLVSFIPELGGRLALKSLLEGICKLLIFLLYLFLCSRLSDIQRTFSYHGAEHKTIFCYEKGFELTVENVRLQSRFHPRCGTSFLLVVVILGVFLGFLIQVDNPFARMGLRLLLLPVLVSAAYELNRWVGRRDNALTKALAAPGKALQRLTTNEPDDSMIEVAIEALRLVIPEKSGADAW